MAQSVSNDALWEKLSEISEQLNKLSTEPKAQIISKEEAENCTELNDAKDLLIAEIKQQAYLLGKHGDSNYKAINQNIAASDEIIRNIFNVVIQIRKEQKATLQPQADKLKAYFNLKLFKIKKTSFVIAVLGLLVFLLTIFCVKL